jgi:hypothetical protein
MSTDAFDPQLVTYALMAATLVKIVVDLIRIAVDPPQWVAPILAIVLGIVFVMLIMIAIAVPYSRVALAQAIIAGVLSGGMSIGSTALQARTPPPTGNGKHTNGQHPNGKETP